MYPLPSLRSKRFPLYRTAKSVVNRLALLIPMAALPCAVLSKDFDWSLGAYSGKYYDTEPAGFLKGDANFKEQYIFALNGSKTIWRSASLPMSVEIDAVLAQQSGLASLTEIAVAPVLRWSGFPWNSVVQTDLRLAPLGISYTSEIGPLERGPGGDGSKFLNFLMIEAAFSSPQNPSNEVFMRLHHRCAVYDLINNYGANGQDFFTLGYRKRF
jgi:hypothetical protein